ncbi:hypothetical protein GOP47_0022778 [Adiantum capillus-veneris]|uniref:Uncharacterized protein n=1 Tax=Adiantum capillus-veneris TaxID=13818 RepID=A0A9D4U613_ADICA|nr:hypothetical protein GOP47_0022778 [Adiantum capillus-veneris]
MTNTHEAQNLQNDGFSFSAQREHVLHSTLSSHDIPPQESIACLRNFFDQEDQLGASLSSFGDLFAFHTKASEFAAILKEDSPALNLNWSSPSNSKQQGLLAQPREDVSILESLPKCSTELVQGNRVVLLNSLKSSRSMPSKVLDVGLFRYLLSPPSILHKRERDEVSDVEKPVNGNDEAQRIGSALKPRKNLIIGKPRFHKYADMSISKLRYYDEFGDMKIGKPGLPMYIELYDMLLQCGYAVGVNDTNAAKAVAWKVMQQTSPYGSAAERLAYYFVKALYARFAGTGWSLYRGHLDQHRPSFTQILEAKMKYISSCPFTQASHLFSNETILRVAKGASTLVIIEHQMSGIQYPSLFKKLAALPGGPPKVSLIGHMVPHYSMLPGQTDDIFAALEETGQRLAKCAASFKIPFHFTPWVGTRGSIRLQEFVTPKRLPGEVFVAISTCFLRFVMDDILDPRPMRLKSFKKICDARPDVFIQGVVSGAYSTPFYSARFKEALSHFACIFDVLDTFIGRGSQDRLVFESEVLGKAIVNVVACEGLLVSGRVENYKQWQAISEETGMQQVALNANTVHQVEGLLKSWHKDYLITEDRQYLLLGWRGRTLYALSTWKAAASSWEMPS